MVVVAAVAVTVVTAGTAAPVLATAAVGMVSGGCVGVMMEVFNEVVIEDRKELNIGRVLVAGVAGVVAGIPGVGIIGDAAIGGVAEFVMSKLDGNSNEEALKDGFFGVTAGLAIGGAFKLIGKVGSKIISKVKITKTVISDTIDDVANKADDVINKVDDNLVAKTIDIDDKQTLFAKSNVSNIESTLSEELDKALMKIDSDDWVFLKRAKKLESKLGDVKISTEDLARIIKTCDNNPDAKEVMLGRFFGDSNMSYEQLGKELGMNYFNIDCYKELKRVYGEDFVTKINEEFVINAVEKQKKICFNVNPKYTDGVSLKKEWKLLEELYDEIGFKINVDSFEINYQNEEIELWKLVFVKEI